MVVHTSIMSVYCLLKAPADFYSSLLWEVLSFALSAW